jgi:hypothetical protein
MEKIVPTSLRKNTCRVDYQGHTLDMSKEGCARVVAHIWTSSPYCYTLETGLHKNVKVDDKGIEKYGEDFYSIKTY